MWYFELRAFNITPNLLISSLSTPKIKLNFSFVRESFNCQFYLLSLQQFLDFQKIFARYYHHCWYQNLVWAHLQLIPFPDEMYFAIVSSFLLIYLYLILTPKTKIKKFCYIRIRTRYVRYSMFIKKLYQFTFHVFSSSR